MSRGRFVSWVARFAAALAFILALPLGTTSMARAEGTPVTPQGVVNINTARAEELMLLPRIGEEKARRIIEQRTKAPFKTVNELTRVKGIGLRTLRNLKPYVRVEGPTTLTSEVRGTGVEDGPLDAPADARRPAGLPAADARRPAGLPTTEPKPGKGGTSQYTSP